MAGGMRRRNALGTLAERRGAVPGPSGPRPPPGDAAADGPSGPPDRPRASGTGPVPRVRHCWVATPDGEVPGLLLGWERRPGGWYGRVVHPAPAPGRGWAVVEDWVPGSALRPLVGEPG